MKTMNYFWDFDVQLKDKIDWMFNVNHLFLISFVAIFIVALMFLLNAKSEKGQKITKICLACVLFILEITRIIWDYQNHLHNGGTSENFNWWWTISFQMCAIMTWTTIITLIVSACVKNKQARVVKILENILFGVAMVGGILTFVYPDCITTDKPFLHFVNIQTIITHSLLIFAPLYLIKIKELKIEMKNIWMPALGFLYVGCLATATSIISGNNFAFALECDLLKDVGLNIPYPWHYLFVFLIVFLLTVLLYGVFEIRNHIKNKNIEKQVEKPNKNKNVYALSVLTFVFLCFQGLLMMLFMGQAIYISGQTSLLGILMLIPFIVAVLLILLGLYYNKLSNDDNFKKNKKSKIFIVTLIFAFVLNIVVGIYQLALYYQKEKQ